MSENELSRKYVLEILLRLPPGNVHDKNELDANDAAQRARIAELEAENERLRTVVDAVRGYYIEREKECAHGHPIGAWMDGLMCHECMKLWDKAWIKFTVALAALDKKDGE